MPDHSSAAEEYAILQEITAPPARLLDDPLRVTADVDFPVALRGYDRAAVDAYVKRTSRLVAELDATRSPEAAVHRALETVGEQISGVIQRARDTAEQITTQSRGEAEDRLEVARQEAAEIVAAAALRVNDLEADAERISAERLRLVNDARELAGQLIALTDAATTRFPPDEPDVRAQSDAPEPKAVEPEAAEPEGGEPDLGAESQAVAELWAAASGHTPEHDLTEVLPPVGPAQDGQPPEEEHTLSDRDAPDRPS